MHGELQRGSHAVWGCKYQIMQTTKYSFTVLDRGVGNRCHKFLREISRGKEMTIYAGSLNRDYMHMLISIPPQL